MHFNKERFGLILIFTLTAAPLIALPFIPISDVSPNVEKVINIDNEIIEHAIVEEKGNIIENQKKGLHDQELEEYEEPEDIIVMGGGGIPQWGENAKKQKEKTQQQQ